MTSMEAAATSASAAAVQPDLTVHWIGLTALAVFAAGYALVIAEESIHLRKSKPMVAAAGLLWVLVGAFFPSIDHALIAWPSAIRMTQVANFANRRCADIKSTVAKPSPNLPSTDFNNVLCRGWDLARLIAARSSHDLAP
jgi:hypothetical protein